MPKPESGVMRLTDETHDAQNAFMSPVALAQLS